ncbi:MAG: hypothetical protein ABL982_07325 [Vicinamibacterales bacterium]
MPPDTSHDDVSSSASRRRGNAAGNEAHEQNDDGPDAPYPDPDGAATGSEAGERVSPEPKPLSDMAPPGQDAVQGSD